MTYLQELHSVGLANSDHTTLLLNTYTKLKDVTRLDSFIKRESLRTATDGEKDELPFDLDTAIRVCRQAGYFEHASYLAKKYERHEDYLRIQIEDAGNYKDALTYLRKLGAEAVSGHLRIYDASLIDLPRPRAILPGMVVRCLRTFRRRQPTSSSTSAPASPLSPSRSMNQKQHPPGKGVADRLTCRILP